MTATVTSRVTAPVPRSAEDDGDAARAVPAAAAPIPSQPGRVSACPVHAHPAGTGPAPLEIAAVDVAEAESFLRLYYAEQTAPLPFDQRMRGVRAEIEETGSYTHTLDELTFGARVAWRNSERCVGRLYWNSLRVRDRRQLSEAKDVGAECVEHLREAYRDGRIRSTITVFAPDRPGAPGPRIHNDQLTRYAGHRLPDGSVRGDPLMADFTTKALAMGWRRPERLGRFDLLPLIITGGGGDTEMIELPADAVHEVPIRHPEHGWFAELRLRWYAVPTISNLPLEIGGVRYPATPFNGWYVATEIGARNFADSGRYNLLPAIAARLGLDTGSVRTMWQERAQLELTRAVLWSFEQAEVSMADQHTEADRFLTHLEREEQAGRSCPADWSWIVPPMGGSLTSVFHRYYDQADPRTRPAFLRPEA